MTTMRLSGMLHKQLFLIVNIILLGLCASVAAAADWRPDRTVELIVGAAAGGSQDTVMRVLQQAMQSRKLVDVPVLVVNKSGAGGALALNYLTQYPGDGRYVLLLTPTALASHISGRTAVSYTDTTPLALLFTEPFGFIVKGDSTIKDGREFTARLRKDPTSISIAIGTAFGNANHIALIQVLKAAGLTREDLRKLKLVAFKAGSEGMTALLGGHIDALVLTPTGLGPHIQTGQLRMIALAAEKRLTGSLANVPTWKELGVNVTGESGRVMVGAKGLTPQQVAFWENVFERAVATDEWRKEIDKNFWVADFRKHEAARQYLDARYEDLKGALTEIGMVK